MPEKGLGFCAEESRRRRAESRSTRAESVYGRLNLGQELRGFVRSDLVVICIRSGSVAMGKKQKKAGAGKEKTLRKTAKSEEKQRKREDKKLKEEDDIDAILVRKLSTELHVVSSCLKQFGSSIFTCIECREFYQQLSERSYLVEFNYSNCTITDIEHFSRSLNCTSIQCHCGH